MVEVVFLAVVTKKTGKKEMTEIIRQMKTGQIGKKEMIRMIMTGQSGKKEMTKMKKTGEIKMKKTGEIKEQKMERKQLKIQTTRQQTTLTMVVASI